MTSEYYFHRQHATDKSRHDQCSLAHEINASAAGNNTCLSLANLIATSAVNMPVDNTRRAFLLT
jgi:hypothetical protein